MKLSLARKDSELKELREKLDDTERLRFRVEQLQTQVGDLSSRLATLSAEKATLENTLIQRDTKKDEVEASKVVVPSSENTSLDFKRLESSTLDTYLKQIETLNGRVHYLDSKAFYYYDEMKSMLERLKLQIDANGAQESDLNEIRDQLERTRSSYEMQMSTMSDHLIEMTDRMTKQAEENENLKHELSLVGAQQSAQSALASGKASSKSKKSK